MMNRINLHSFLLVLFCIHLIGCKEEVEQKPVSVRPVKYEEVGNKTSKFERTFSGTSRTEKVVNLSFRNSGILTLFDVRLGQQVKKGQLIGSLDNVQARLNHENSISRLNSAESKMNTSKLNLNRVRKLYEKGGAALSDYEAAKNSYKHAEQSYESAIREVAIHKEQIQYGYLYAPENGVIAEVLVELDENISPGQVVAVLNAGSNMEVSLGIPENVINELHVDMPCEIEFPSIHQSQIRGIVREIAPAIDINTSTYPIRISIENPTDIIKSGMAANVTFDFSDSDIDQSEEENIIIPAKAVGEDSEGRFVFVVEPSDTNQNLGIIKKQHIMTEELTTSGFAVKSGVSKGQKIAVAGLQTLLDGQQVRIK